MVEFVVVAGERQLGSNPRYNNTNSLSLLQTGEQQRIQSKIQEASGLMQPQHLIRRKVKSDMKGHHLSVSREKEQP